MGELGEFLVNSYTEGEQSAPDTATLIDGSFVVTWQSFAQDSSGFGIYCQRYTCTGVPVGGEFVVNTVTLGNQASPSITMLSDGGFLIVWQSGGINGQRYSSEGVAVGEQFKINYSQAEGYDQVRPVATVLMDGGFVVAWEAYNRYSDPIVPYIEGRFFSSDGVALSGN